MRVLVLAALIACKSKHAPPPVVHDANIDAGFAWTALDDYPRVEAIRTIALPAKRDVPNFDVGGPVVTGNLAIVSSSQLGFVAIDVEAGNIVWTKQAGLHVAPPLLHGTSIVLIGDCFHPPAQWAANEELLGCLRVVTPTGADEAYIAIRGLTGTVEAFANEKGPQRVWEDGEQAVVWRRGEQAVRVDLLSGVAKPVPIDPPPLVVTYKGKRWELRQVEGVVVATGAKPWQSEHAFTEILGKVQLPEMNPFVRVASVHTFRGDPEITVHDIDATGSLNMSTARPVPGIDLLAHGISPDGDAALAVRLDRSRKHDFIAGFTANAFLAWVFVLPEREHRDAIGVAVADQVVVAFHDGDTLTVLPELSAPPTAPGATKGASQIPTP